MRTLLVSVVIVALIALASTIVPKLLHAEMGNSGFLCDMYKELAKRNVHLGFDGCYDE